MFRKIFQKRWFKFLAAAVLIVVAVGGYFAWKTGYTLNKISGSENSALGSLLGSGATPDEQDGRINVLLLGMRGANMPGGGLLADSIMVASLDTKNNRVGLISVPRDLWVQIPGTNERGKINSVYSHWESGGRGQGIEKMKEMMGTITGLKINKAVAINFEGFRQLIDAVGGIDVRLPKGFSEPLQFVEGNECGGVFTLPAGTNHLNGEKALCYARSRVTTNDFDRSKRQQIILQALKDKMISLGTLADFTKINKILDIAGANVKTDLTPEEMKGFYDQYGQMKEADIVQLFFENSEKGLLRVPEAGTGLGYVLVPIAGQDNYTQLQDASRNVFSSETQK
ncbi:MAG: Cell envelope-related function transcriptional attenuator common domain containing protein [Candidatus Moranbacteria bacterium GW2011_GWC1_45_18]|nr:MAG: Cell envelope-related function transcriptional attenuator common domain containing protein [Candidatus Moranbacteria bacterium GW2011_GWC2_40_12]KKT32084.1 MAG: Cell envelope-related function transcriptional attenuator common domain containing protein [Candidatus Moranbacteria bacterium GW2011_GWF2_44_10]KKT99230.1 MAG: Cell envelope-related function transcriptional attenuator common domain containing protein [Candidatus Moranbacteria bacterium GW2011_GWC1_45_18]OGI36826.1 MAG: hypotheti